MYAIIADCGRNYTVSVGQVIEMDKKQVKSGEAVDFENVLYFKSDEETLVGAPTVAGVKVKGIAEGDFKDKKIDVMKFKRRKNYRKKQGHRQTYTKVRIKEIVKE